MPLIGRDFQPPVYEAPTPQETDLTVQVHQLGGEAIRAVNYIAPDDDIAQPTWLDQTLRRPVGEMPIPRNDNVISF